MNLVEAFYYGVKIGRRSMVMVAAVAFQMTPEQIHSLYATVDAMPMPVSEINGQRLTASQMEEALLKGSEPYVFDSPTDH